MIEYMAYTRAQGSTDSRPGSAFGPKRADHPTVEMPCPACGVPFAAGDWTTLVTLGPGGDPDAQKKASAGGWYTAVALEVHFACAMGREPTEDEKR